MLLKLFARIKQQLVQRGRQTLHAWMERRTPPATHFLLTQRNVYIFPTGQGVLFAATLFVMLLGAINYQNNLGFITTFLLAGIGLVSIFHTFRNLARLTLSAEPLVNVHAGDNIQLKICLDASTHNSRGILGSHHAIVLSSEGQASASLGQVPAGGKQVVKLQVAGVSRGLFKMPRILIETTFPLGLVRAWTWLTFDRACYVFPKPVRYPLNVPEQVHHSTGQLKELNGSDDFCGHRPYQQGDSPRAINWRLYARERGLHTKQFDASCAGVVWLDWQQLPNHGTEWRLGVLAYWVQSCVEQGYCFGLRIPGTEIPPGTSPSHALSCLKALALINSY